MHNMPRPKSATRGEATSLIQSLDRGLIILEAVARSSEPVSVAELTAILGIERSSVFRLANTLKRRGFLACPSGRKNYILGPSMWRLSHHYNWSRMLVMIAHDHLRLLASQTGETAHLAVREGRQALFIDHVAGNHVIAVSGQTGELGPLHCTAHGKALLTDFDKPALMALFGATPLQVRTRKTIVSLDELAANCSDARSRGYMTDDEEFQDGLRCVAAPIRDDDGVIIGSIGISAPATRLTEQQLRTRGEQVSRVARDIHELLSDEKQNLAGRAGNRR
jgi:DNA-binding IclR family transcriptional regulator